MVKIVWSFVIPKDVLKLNKFSFEKRVGVVSCAIFFSVVGFFTFLVVVFVVVGVIWVVLVVLEEELVLDDELVVLVVDSVASALT